MFKAFIPAVVLTASLCSVAHAAQDDSSASQQQVSAIQNVSSDPAMQQAPGLTRKEVYDQLVQAEQDGELARLRAQYKGR
ncbi:hypothetical protein [Pararobbsia alpina]|uniref:DUF4148 domain-containing protein n=1 Tax=Pararobbsia alpina TaxID=621374 RepID=A0A6S7B4E3_9BURK|nr:hypothetical protein [Pararobbsia alpina]CAB3780154.1 hypothetical protein LMG28138_00980 [Pararobbsia alpina]